MTARQVAAAQRGVALPASSADAAAAGLNGAQRQELLDVLIAVLGGAYAHLPAKRAAYANDPVQAMILLQRRAGTLSDAEFHRAVTAVVTGLRDAHTRYTGPTAQHGRVAALPFLVEQFGHLPTYLVTKVAAQVEALDPEFVPGVRPIWWNAVPFDRAVDIHADRESGGRTDARRARALQSLTFRALDHGPPPDEHWVRIGYRTRRRTLRELTLPWRLLTPDTAAGTITAFPNTPGHAAGPPAGLRLAVDPGAEAVRRAKKLLFAPALWAADRATEPAHRAAVPASAVGEPVPTPMQDFVSAQIVRARRRKIGYLRIWSFGVRAIDAFLDEVERLLTLLPTDGIVVDLRGNPGGLVWAAERLLQLFGGAPVRPTRFAFLASPMTRAMAASDANQTECAEWLPSLEDAVSTGELWAQPRPLTPIELCNDRGRRYPGPAVAVVDPITYSSGDLFAAGWVDNRIGPLVTVGQASGGGGANVWTSSQLHDALDATGHDQPPLPGGTSYTIAIRRAIRSGLADGIPIEDLGITATPTTTYTMTARDLLGNNQDLLAFCADLLTELRTA